MENYFQCGHCAIVRRAAVCVALVFLAFASPAQCLPAPDSEARAVPDTGLPIGGRVVTVYVSQEHGEPRDEQVRLPDSVLDEIASRQEGFANRLAIWDSTASYSWLRHGRILECQYSDTVIYLETSGRAVILNQKSGYGQIRELLQSHFPDALQDKKKFQVMLDALQYWTVPRSVLGTGEEFKRMERHGELKSWLRGKVKDASVFRKYCRDPILSYDRESGKWSLSFYVFNPGGGVSQVKAYGSDKPFRMEELTVEDVMEAGSFSYPLVG